MRYNFFYSLTYSLTTATTRSIANTRALCFLIFLLYSIPSQATPSVQSYSSLPSVSMMAMSPSGDLVSFKKITAEGDEQLVVYSLKDKKILAGTQLTDLTLLDIGFLHENHVVFKAYERQRVLGYRDTINLSTAFVLDIKSGKSRQLLTPGHGIHTGQTGLGIIAGLSKDKKYALMPAYHREQGRTYSNLDPTYALVRTRLDKISKPKVMSKGTSGTKKYLVDVNGNALVEERYNEKEKLHTIRSKFSGKWKVIYKNTTAVRNISLGGLSHDYSSVVVLDTSPKTGRIAYYHMSLSDGSLSTSIFENANSDVEALLKNSANVVFGVRYSGFHPTYEFLEPSLNQLTKKFINDFPDHSVFFLGLSDNKKNWLLYVDGPSTSGTYYVFGDGKYTKVADARPDMTSEHINPIIKMNYKSQDGLIIPALVTVPKSKALENLPMIVMPHNGPASYNKIAFHWMAQAFASRGYLVLQPQFRGSKGFGSQFEAAGDGQWGKKMQDDITYGIKALAEEKVADPTKVCIVGRGYGGYAALAGGAFTPDLYRCIVSINGVSDLPKMLKNEMFDHGMRSEIYSYWKRNIGGDDLDTSKLKDISPARFAQQFSAPVLLIHGKEDAVVPISQSKLMHRRLKSANKNSSLITLSGNNHYLSHQKGRTEALEAVINFVAEHIPVTVER